MTDRELLERAAKAAGMEIAWADGPNNDPVVAAEESAYWQRWNPLADDGDALRLAVKLGLSVRIKSNDRAKATVIGYFREDQLGEPHGPDPYAATRRAIVRAAAAMAGE